jgi:2,3-bisphosphoglycerate-dependent phosphoglycerate mutase
MKKLLPFLIIILLTIPSFSQEDFKDILDASTYYFIRHAEKNISDKDDIDPPLVIDGILRAAKWSLVFDNIKFDAIYSTDFLRTKETAQPTAEKNNIDITLYDPTNIDTNAFLESTKGQTVLIVGHSNTTPMFVNAIIGEEKYEQIEETINGNLYIVTISKSGDINDTLLSID